MLRSARRGKPSSNTDTCCHKGLNCHVNSWQAHHAGLHRCNSQRSIVCLELHIYLVQLCLLLSVLLTLTGCLFCLAPCGLLAGTSSATRSTWSARLPVLTVMMSSSPRSSSTRYACPNSRVVALQLAVVNGMLKQLHSLACSSSSINCLQCNRARFACCLRGVSAVAAAAEQCACMYCCCYAAVCRCTPVSRR